MGACPTSYDEVGVGEEVLGLHESPSVPRVEEVKDAVRIDSDRPVHCRGGGIKTLKTIIIRSDSELLLASC